jgi:hypothetical protein
VKSAASGNCSHHLLLSRGNSHHRRKTQYIGGLIYGYCLYCYKLFIYGIIFVTQRISKPHIYTFKIFEEAF